MSPESGVSKSIYRGLGIYDVKGSVWFVLKFATETLTSARGNGPMEVEKESEHWVEQDLRLEINLIHYSNENVTLHAKYYPCSVVPLPLA